MNLFELVVVTVLTTLITLSVARIFARLMSFACWWQERLRTSEKWMTLRYRVRYPWDSERRAQAEFSWGWDMAGTDP